MLTRVEVSGTQRITYTQGWNAENRLIAVTNTTTLSVTRFYYDGDALRDRVKKADASGTTVYVGALEKNVTANITTTYYYAGSTRIALRQQTPITNVVYYLHGDHLGSASLTTNASGAPTSQLRYLPYGAPRPGYPSGSVPTDYRFTGQRSEEATLGSLYDYGARMYSPYLNRWIQPDTIVPQPGNPQDLNRYSYTRNNPLKYIDPSGHSCTVVNGQVDCSNDVINGTSTISIDMRPIPMCFAPAPPDDPLDLKLARVLMWGFGAVSDFGGGAIAAQNSGSAAQSVPFVPGTGLGGSGSANNLVAASFKVPPSPENSSASALPAPASPVGLLANPGYYNPWGGPPTSVVLDKPVTLYRAWRVAEDGTDNRIGRWLSPTRPPNASVAQSGLALPDRPQYVSEVHIPASTRVQVGWAGRNFNQPGGALQVQIIGLINPNWYGQGVPLP
jgi:RHS repeat-associated protein